VLRQPKKKKKIVGSHVIFCCRYVGRIRRCIWKKSITWKTSLYIFWHVR